MTGKRELTEIMMKEIRCTKQEANVVIDTFLSEISESLSKGERVELRGFGSFRLRERAARLGRNPRTGEEVQVPAKTVVYFTPGKKLKEDLNRL